MSRRLQLDEPHRQQGCDAHDHSAELETAKWPNFDELKAVE
jgi:hypothetical protein